MQTEFVKIAQDLPGAEGPCFDTQCRFYMVVPDRGQLVRVAQDGQVSEFANTGGIPAGLQCDPDDNLWVADMKLGILKVTAQGQIEHVVAEYGGGPMRGCNDCAFDSQGNLYFTAPAGSNAQTPEGEIYCLARDGRVTRLDGGFQFCNGIAVTADDRTLIVAETMTRSLWAYDIVEPGVVAHKRLWSRMPNEQGLGPDGMDFDEAGYLLVAYWGGSAIEVYDPQGHWVDGVVTPFAAPSNVHFGGPDGRWVYVTEHTNNALWKFHWVRQGQPQYCAR
jgi:gluconolactonase